MGKNFVKIRRIKIPEEHRDIISELCEKDGWELLLHALQKRIKRDHDEFWKAVRAAVPEIEDVEEALHYNKEREEIWWID